MTSIREWRTAIINAIQNSFPVTEVWVTPYRRTSTSKLALASAAATTESDRNGIALLTNELGFVKMFTDKYVERQKQGVGTFPDDLNDDPLSQQILTCARELQLWPQAVNTRTSAHALAISCAHSRLCSSASVRDEDYEVG